MVGVNKFTVGDDEQYLPLSVDPFTRGQYVAKFRTLADGVIAAGVQNRFLEAVTRLPDLDAGELAALALPGIAQAGGADRDVGDPLMLHDTTTASQKRAAFRALLASGNLLRFPGAFSPLTGTLIARHGFDGVYISGAVISADLGLPDIGLTTLSEVAGRAQQIARVTRLPALADADTGFGEPMNTARTAPSG